MKKLITLLLLMNLSVIAFAMNRGEIRIMSRDLSKDSTVYVNTPMFQDSFYNTAINEVQADIAFYTRCNYATYYVDTTSTTPIYAKPPRLIAIDRVSYLGYISTNTPTPYKKIAKVTMHLLDRDLKSWENYSQGTPLYYHEDSTTIVVTPRVAGRFVKTNGLKINYYKYPAEMTSDTDIPFDNDTALRGYHQLIVLGTVLWVKRAMWLDVSINLAEYNGLKESMRREIRNKPDIGKTSIKVKNRNY